ncbi:hypothetical protein LY90DRAFT_76865, partial [Neocallimastix californiae]
MRFIKQVLALASLTSVLALNQEEIIQRLEKCIDEINNYSSCNISFRGIESDSQLDSYCARMTSSKCREFTKDPYSVLQNCYLIKDNTDLRDLININSIKTLGAEVKEVCAKDERGEYCPLSITHRTSVSQYDIRLRETCKRPSCAAADRQLQNDYIRIRREQGYGYFRDYQSRIDYLDSAECKNLANPPKPTTTRRTTTTTTTTRRRTTTTTTTTT